jgi:hypothetical protein
MNKQSNETSRILRSHTSAALTLALFGTASAFIVSGCIADAGGEVEGSWCGRAVETAEQCAGDEVGYVELQQSGSEVSGTFCEAYEWDCYPVEGGSFEDDTLTFSYSFPPYTVDGELTLDGDTLTGSFFSSKCDCSIPVTLHRLRDR